MKKTTRSITFGHEMRQKLLGGARKVYEIVGSTMGPNGRNAIYDRHDNYPLVLNDGIRICRQVDLADPVEAMAVDLIRQASELTNRTAGDGTSLTVVLAYAIFAEGLKLIENDIINPMVLKKEIGEAVNRIAEKIKEMAVPADTDELIYQIANISSQSPDIGKAISEIVSKIGRDMPLTVERGSQLGIHTKITDGMRFDKGFVVPHFNNNPERLEFLAEGCHIAVIDQNIGFGKDMIKILETVFLGAEKAQKKRNLLLVCEDIEREAFVVALQNHLTLNSNFFHSVCCVTAPGYGKYRREFMEDLAVLTGATYISPEAGLNMQSIEYKHFGWADKVITDSISTTIIKGAGDKETVANRIKEIEALKKQTTDEFATEKLDERLAKLKGGVGIMQVMAKTDSEQEELMLRVEDAVLAVKSAIAEGILPGGGKSLMNLAGAFKNEPGMGFKVLLKALSYPFRQIVDNSGGNGDLVYEDILRTDERDVGYDAVSGKYVNLMKEGIIDPAKVVREAIQNGASIASLLLTANSALSLDKINLSAK